LLKLCEAWLNPPTVTGINCMSVIEIALIALALSIDAFAVSMAAAAAGRVQGRRAVFRLSFHFGLFQFLMPIIGWAAGATLEPYIASFDHWIAFILLMVVGVRMLIPSDESKAMQIDDPSRGLMLLTLATATSIDALAVGLSLAMLNVSVWLPSVVIGLVAGGMSLVGITLGSRLQVRLGRKAEVLGGIILIVIAIRIVVEHTLLS
jgi:putative Mn2+ efflux pump MntP